MRYKAIPQKADSGHNYLHSPSICTAHGQRISSKYVGTAVAALLLLVKPQTLLKSHSQKGNYASIRPTRLPSRKLAWPLQEIEALLNSGFVSIAKGARHDLT